MLTAIKTFLACETPMAWVDAALTQQELLLIDHAHCEKKAASTALSLMYRYVEHGKLLHMLSRLAREELRHFEKVLSLLTQRGIAYTHLTSARYATELRKHLSQKEPQRLVDTLIIGAFIEARSCERFACLVPHLDPDLSDFYASLVKAESRHFENYLAMAHLYAPGPCDERIAHFAEVEAQLILSPDPEFRFHSGMP